MVTSMRRLLLTSIGLLALALPATALAVKLDPGDGTLVVRNGDNGDGVAQSARAVVSLTINGFAIGRVAGIGRIEIYDLDPADDAAPEVTGADSHNDVTRTFGDKKLTGTKWSGDQFSFRAANGDYRILIYGSGVFVFAGGNGTVWFTGDPDDPPGDGSYSLNGGSFKSLADTAKSGLTIAPDNS